MVEFAIVSPVLMLLALGALEFGSLFLARATAAEASRAAAVTAVAAQGDPLVDQRIIASVARQVRLADDESQLMRVVIFDAAGGGEVDPECLGRRARRRGGVDGVCNAYEPGDLRDVRRGVATFGDCRTGMDRRWCPLGRDHGDGAAIGVWIEVRYPGVTGFFSWVDGARFPVSIVVSNSDEGYR